MILKFDDFINSQKCNESFDPSMVQIMAMLLAMSIPALPLIFRKNIKKIINGFYREDEYFSVAYTFSKLIFKYKDKIMETDKYPMLKNIINGNIWKKRYLKSNKYYKSWKGKSLRNGDLYSTITTEGLDDEVKELMSHEDYMSFVSCRHSTFKTAMDIKYNLNESLGTSKNGVSDTDMIIMLFTIGQAAFLLDGGSMDVLKNLLKRNKKCKECFDGMKNILHRYEADFSKNLISKISKTMDLDKAQKTLDDLNKGCEDIMSEKDFKDFTGMVEGLRDAMERIDDEQNMESTDIADMDKDDLDEIFDK